MNNVVVNKQVLKDIAKLPHKERLLIKDFIINLKNITNPMALPNCKKLVGKDNYYRYRIRNYRLLCEILNKNTISIIVFKVSHRKDMYRF